MAELIRKDRVDDLAYRAGRQVPADERVEFALDGDRYVVDLTAENAARLRQALAEFVEVAAIQAPQNPARSRSRRDNAAKIRAWAKASGLDVNNRGRIPDQVRRLHEETTAVDPAPPG